MGLTLAADFIAQSLVDAGVANVYGGHGGALVPLVNAVVSHPELRWVCTRNEANASLMAAADTKLSGPYRLGACIATSGPGASNLVTGLLDAQLDRVPLIAITGTKPRADSAHSEFQDIDQARMFAAGGLPYSVTVCDPLQLVSIMRDAVATALSQRVCVHVAVPVDIQGMMIQAPTHLCSAQPSEIRKRVEKTRGDSETLDAVAAQLAMPGERVVVAVGLDARGAGAEILQLAEVLHSPVVTRLDAKGVIDESHPLAMGVVGVHGKPGLAEAAAILDEATLVLAIGVSDLTVLLCDDLGLQVRPMIQISIDAYGVSSRFRAQHSLIANPALACTQLIERLNALSPKDAPDNPGEEVQESKKRKRSAGLQMWHSVLTSGAWQDAPDHGLETSTQQPETPGFCHPAALLRSLSGRVRADDVVCVDTGDITLWTSLFLRLSKGTITLSSERLGTMGYALCAGIAASLTRGPHGKAIVIAGDGGFQMTMNELGTAVQHKANLLIIVLDNGVLGRVEFGFKNAAGCAITGCDWVALARAYGADGMHVASDEQTEEAVERGMAAQGVFVIAAHTDPHLKAAMAKTSDVHHPVWLAAPQQKVDSG